MRVLVTGATGFIGCYLVPRLQQQGQEVTLLLRPHYHEGRSLPAPLAALRPGPQLVYADLRQAEETALAVAQARPDVVFHLAAAGVSEPFIDVEKALSNNLQGTLNLLHACYATGRARPRFVNARTPGERSALNVYAASKAAAWKFCQMYARTEGWPIMGAMIFQAYGPGQPAHTLVAAALEAALAGADFPATSGQQERDWIYVEDVVGGLAAFLGAELAPGSSAELGTGCPQAVAAVVRQIYQMVGRGGQPQIGALPDRPGEVARQAADAARTASLLGWRARYSLQEGLQQMLTQRTASAPA